MDAYLIIAIFGVEYAMNLQGGLRNNVDRSPLYPKGLHDVEQ